MTLATVEPAVSVSPGFARLYEDADRMLDAFLERERELDRLILDGLDRSEPIDLEAVMTNLSNR